VGIRIEYSVKRLSLVIILAISVGLLATVALSEWPTYRATRATLGIFRSEVFLPSSASSCAATCYYVSPTGSDSNLGTRPSAPWRTLGKVQSFQAKLRPGDSVLLQRGGVWYEQFDIINMNGSSGFPITIGNYGTGNLPVIDGGQTSFTSGRHYCIDAINTSYKWITVDGIECRNAYKQAITFKAYTGTGTNGVGIVVQNSYIHHDGSGACTNCGPKPAPDPGGYVNQLDAQYTTSVKFLNNTLDHLGGHNALNVHYDKGNALVSGNVVGTNDPWYNHNGIDVKGGAGTLVTNNFVTCPTCGGAAFYTENPLAANEHITYIGNVAFNNWNAFQIETGGTCQQAPCAITARFYNNTIYNSSNQTNFVDTSCTNHTLDIRKNIIDGGATEIRSNCTSIWDYNDDGGVYPISGNPVGPHDLKQVNPQYVNASSGNFKPQNTTILTYGANDPVTRFPYLGGVPGGVQ
jgi:hypothetical protein